MDLFYIGLSFLSTGRQIYRETASATRNALLSAEGRRLLSILDGGSFTENDIAKTENGRPFFPDNRGDFSISHSGNMVAISMVKNSREKSLRLRTGCDIQRVYPRKNIMSIAEEFFCAAERDYIFSFEQDYINQALFYHIWTLKESYIKFKGLSVFEMSRMPSFISRDTTGRLCFSYNAPAIPPLSFNLYELYGSGEQYILATVVEGNENLQPEIRWFSRSCLSCNKISEIKTV